MTPDTLAALCATAMPGERLTPGELERICFGDADEVIGDEYGAAAYTVQHFGDLTSAWLLLVAVHPARQGRGHGKDLVRAACDGARARGARTMHLANAIPRYVWPGVEVTNTRAGMLFETLGFERDLVAVNMTISTTFRREPPPGVTVARDEGGDAIAFARRAYPHWVEELACAVGRGMAFTARSEDGTPIGFACHSVNRQGWIGPMATEPDRQHGGVGSALLAAVCHDLAARGEPTGEIAWVSNLRFYGKCGATVSRVFQGGRRALA